MNQGVNYGARCDLDDLWRRSKHISVGPLITKKH